ncbi:MAG TPA: polysaccharide biosynthesis C-terminal domain-containing protein [Steroidobacteraceae bacterium]|nr:polysaccharide biosynthesis C-terminal domain-containing protein [Steroidobacteraceae bacterium]
MSIRKNAAALVICRVSGDGLNLLFFVLISRAFGPDGIGTYAYGYAVTTFVYAVGCLGVEDFGLREYARMDPARRAHFMAELLGTQAVMVALALIGLAIYLLLTAPSQPVLMVVLSLGAYQIGSSIAGTLFVPAMGQQLMLGPAAAEPLCRALAMVIASLAIWLAHASLAQSLMGYPIAGVLNILLAAGSARRHGGALRVDLSRPAIARIAGILAAFSGIEILVQLLARVGVIALTLLRGPAAAGFYATGLKLVEVALRPLNFTGIAAYPRLSLAYRQDRTLFLRTSEGLLWLMLLAAGGLAWVLYYVAPWLLVPLLGVRYAGAEPVVRLISLIAALQACETILGRLMFAADRHHARALTMAIAAAAAVILNLVMIRKFGVDGAIFATAIAYGLMNLLYVAVLRRPLIGSGMVRVLWTLAVSLLGGIAGASITYAQHLAVWMQAATSAATFALIVGAGYWYAQRAPLDARSVRTQHS